MPNPYTLVYDEIDTLNSLVSVETIVSKAQASMLGLHFYCCVGNLFHFLAARFFAQNRPIESKSLVDDRIIDFGKSSPYSTPF